MADFSAEPTDHKSTNTVSLVDHEETNNNISGPTMGQTKPDIVEEDTLLENQQPAQSTFTRDSPSVAAQADTEICADSIESTEQSTEQAVTPITDSEDQTVGDTGKAHPPLPVRHQTQLKGPIPPAKVLIPLYIYPVSKDTWAPLYQAIERNPQHEFVVVVNPASGPGGHPLPSNDYLREIPKLNQYPNVQTVGYIKIDWCRRPLSATFADIDTYAGWSLSGWDRTYVEGVFVDETPNHFSEERAEYLHIVRKYIRAVAGFGGRRLILENPGTPPDHQLTWYSDSKPDVVFTCEEPYERYIGDEVQNRLSELHYEQPCSGYMISGVPRDQIGQFTRDLRWRAAYIFATDTVDDFYEKFGDGWLDYIQALGSDALDS